MTTKTKLTDDAKHEIVMGHVPDKVDLYYVGYDANTSTYATSRDGQEFDDRAAALAFARSMRCKSGVRNVRLARTSTSDGWRTVNRSAVRID